jgi:hypothetical protein
MMNFFRIFSYYRAFKKVRSKKHQHVIDGLVNMFNFFQKMIDLDNFNPSNLDLSSPLPKFSKIQ